MTGPLCAHCSGEGCCLCRPAQPSLEQLLDDLRRNTSHETAAWIADRKSLLLRALVLELGPAFAELLPDDVLLGTLARRGRWVLEQPEGAVSDLSSGELERLRAANKAAEDAITHTLVRAREDAKGLGYYLGPYTQSFEGLVRALAALLGKDVAEVRAAALGRTI
jgi:hypothetical protein